MSSRSSAEEKPFSFGSRAEDGNAEDADDSDDTSEKTTLDDVQEVVIDEFDEEMWQVTEAMLSVHATLLIDSVHYCPGLIIVGKSGAGKTTAIRQLAGLEEQVYRSDEMTPASFVSHDSSRDEEELEEIDLLPRIKHKSIICSDMSTWFSGEQSTIHDRMSRMARVMDGQGFTRDSGSHGRRGYEGDYLFTFIGASTPLSPRAWNVMGHTGQRFIFHEKQSKEDDRDKLQSDLFDGNPYHERIDQCQSVVHSFLQSLWEEHDGYGGVDNVDVTSDAKEATTYLSEVIVYSRATLKEHKNPDGNRIEPQREHPQRVGAVLRDIAKGRALLDSRTTVQIEDMQVCARIALSTMPKKRRPVIRALLNPKNDGSLMASDVLDAADITRPTAINQMNEVDNLEIAELGEVTNDGRQTKELELRSKFEWPDYLDFPHFGG